MKRQVSNGGGVQARWRRDGRELFYLALDGTLMSVDVKASANSIEILAPKPLFKTPILISPGVDQYDVTADGQRFLLLEPVDDAGPTITVVVNWAEELKRRTGTN